MMSRLILVRLRLFLSWCLSWRLGPLGLRLFLRLGICHWLVVLSLGLTLRFTSASWARCPVRLARWLGLIGSLLYLRRLRPLGWYGADGGRLWG